MPHRRVPLVVGNWKMNPPTIEAAVALAGQIRAQASTPEGLEVAVAPPFPALLPVRAVLAGGSVRLCAQDVHEEEAGAYTGGVSAVMLRDVVELVIVGHSEVRRDRGDTDARVNAKLRRAIAAGLVPILCVGEALEVRRAGAADDFVRAQVRAALAGVGVADAARASIAYEPIWAIGTGVPATGEDARATIAAVREEVRMIYGDATAEAMRILYGGSVTGATITEFTGRPGVDGALVGGASLKPEDFARICASVAQAAR